MVVDHTGLQMGDQALMSHKKDLTIHAGSGFSVIIDKTLRKFIFKQYGLVVVEA